MNQEQKAEKARLQKMYGELMLETFKNIISLHRCAREGWAKEREEQYEPQRLLKEAVAKVKQSSDAMNQLRLKAFSKWCESADLSSSHERILEDWWEEAKRKGEIRSPIIYG